MSKRPLGHGPIQYMGDFKAIAMDYAYYLTLLDEGRLYCLTDRQIYILLAQLDYVGWLTRWYNTEDITQTEVGFIRSDLEEALLSCVDVSILVDQAALNLVDSVTSKQLESQALRDILEDRYDGNPTSINPNAPVTDFGSTGDRYDALCAGLTAFVYQFARSQADSVRAGQVGALLSVAAIAALLIPGLNFFFVVGASIAVLLGLGTIGVTTEVAIAALTDKTALDAVICYMRETLKDLDVTEANWSACLDTYPFPPGSNAAIVADFLKATLADNYLTILNILGQAYTGVIDGDPLPECPCDVPPEARTPVIASIWDPTRTAGILSGPDEDGFWTATSEYRADNNDEAIGGIMDIDGRDFVLTDLTYSSSPACQVMLEDGTPFYIGCNGLNNYTGQTLDEFWSTWPAAGGSRTMQFRMVAP